MPPTHTKTPAPEPARVSSWDSFGVAGRLLALSAGDTKPAYCLTKVRAEGRFVVRFVAMVHPSCAGMRFLLGRNLITVFSGVNSPAKKICAAAAAGRPRASPLRPLRRRRRNARHAWRKNARKRKSALFKLFFRARISGSRSMHRTRGHRRHVPRASGKE